MRNIHGKQQRGQDGGILFLLLVSVAIFAALAFAVSQSLRLTGGAQTALQSDRTTLDIASVMDFMHATRDAVQQMKLSGIDRSSLSFVHPGEAGYDIAPHTFKVFHPQGGGVTYIPVWSSLDDPAEATATEWDFLFNSVDNVGGGNPELLMTLIAVSQPLCEALNKNLVGNNAIPSAGDILGMFKDGTDLIDGGNCAGCSGKPALCVENSGLRAFYFVLDRG